MLTLNTRPDEVQRAEVSTPALPPTEGRNVFRFAVTINGCGCANSGEILSSSTTLHVTYSLQALEAVFTSIQLRRHRSHSVESN